MTPTPIVLRCLQSGPFKLVLVAILAWLGKFSAAVVDLGLVADQRSLAGLFTAFISCSVFLRGNSFEHPVGVIPDGAVEQRIFPCVLCLIYCSHD